MFKNDFVAVEKDLNLVRASVESVGNTVLLHHLGLCLTTKTFKEITGFKRGENKTRRNEIVGYFIAVQF